MGPSQPPIPTPLESCSGVHLQQYSVVQRHTHLRYSAVLPVRGARPPLGPRHHAVAASLNQPLDRILAQHLGMHGGGGGSLHPAMQTLSSAGSARRPNSAGRLPRCHTRRRRAARAATAIRPSHGQPGSHQHQPSSCPRAHTWPAPPASASAAACSPPGMAECCASSSEYSS